jgi:formylglycine-generating enzyme required for sulfatase activity
MLKKVVLLVLALGLLPVDAAWASGAMLRISCIGENKDALVSLNDKLKGQCPLDIAVPAGDVKLSATKKFGDRAVGVFEKQFYVGDGVVQRIDVELTTTLTEAGRNAAADADRKAFRSYLENSKKFEMAFRKREVQVGQCIDEKIDAAYARGQDCFTNSGGCVGGFICETYAARNARCETARKPRTLYSADCSAKFAYPVQPSPDEDIRRVNIEQETIEMAKFKSKGIVAANGKSFRDCDQCPEMVLIPRGKPELRSAQDNPYIEWMNQAEIPYVLAVGKFEVTFDEWDACVAEKACASNPHKAVFATREGRQPVTQINRNDVDSYLEWLSNKTGHQYRLLSHTEFIYAGRAGRMSAFPWGDNLGSNLANCANCGSQWDAKGTAPVGSFPPNDWGLYDVIGNVSEMTADCYHEATAAAMRGAPKKGGAYYFNCSIGNSVELLGGDYYAKGGFNVGQMGEADFGERVGFRLARRIRNDF